MVMSVYLWPIILLTLFAFSRGTLILLNVLSPYLRSLPKLNADLAGEKAGQAGQVVRFFTLTECGIKFQEASKINK